MILKGYSLIPLGAYNFSTLLLNKCRQVTFCQRLFNSPVIQILCRVSEHFLVSVKTLCEHANHLKHRKAITNLDFYTRITRVWVLRDLHQLLKVSSAGLKERTACESPPNVSMLMIENHYFRYIVLEYALQHTVRTKTSYRFIPICIDL